MNPFIHTPIPVRYFQLEDGAGTGEAPAPSPEADAGGEAAPSDTASPPPEKPEWLMDKYKSVEDQAKAYKDLYSRFSKKTDDLKAEVASEYAANFAKERGVPDDLDGYAYPEDVNPPDEELDQALRAWAKENLVSPDAFQALVNDVWMKTQPNIEAEIEKLGEGAEDRIVRVNKWLNANVDERHFGALERLMQTADGVALAEHFIDRMSSSNFSPDDGQPVTNGRPKTREEIRALQADPRFGHDDDYTKMVRNLWSDFARRQ